jgi:hypothetical protein
VPAVDPGLTVASGRYGAIQFALTPYRQAALQGSFIFAKAKQSPEVVRDNLAHLRRYLRALFDQPNKTARKEKS